MRYILLIIVFGLLISCNFKRHTDIEGFWTSGYILLHSRNDTLTFLPFGNKYVFEIKDTNIYLIKRIDTNIYNRDTLKYPFLFGSIIKDNETTSKISTSFFFHETIIFEKILQRKTDLQKIQFSSANWHNGFDFEIDTSGNSYLTETDCRGIHKTYFFMLPKEDTKTIFNLAAYIDFKNLKEKYVNEHCADAPGFGFVFFFKDIKYKTFIFCTNELQSLMPLRCYLDQKTIDLSKDTIKYKETKAKYYESKLLFSFDLIDSIRYLSFFDSVNYKLPIYNKKVVKEIFDKYYKFKDDNICFDIAFDSLGYIVSFNFRFDTIINKKFLYELKKIKPYMPAIYKGQKTAIKDYDCISYIE